MPHPPTACPTVLARHCLACTTYNSLPCNDFASPPAANACGTRSASSMVGGGVTALRVGGSTHWLGWIHPQVHIIRRGCPMSWNKPEVEIVAVTMEVTAYVATL